LPDPLVMHIDEAGIEEPMWVYLSFMQRLHRQNLERHTCSKLNLIASVKTNTWISSPDGRTILYTQLDALTRDIVLVDNFK
jgi:hypothetical protein